MEYSYDLDIPTNKRLPIKIKHDKYLKVCFTNSEFKFNSGNFTSISCNVSSPNYK